MATLTLSNDTCTCYEITVDEAGDAYITVNEYREELSVPYLEASFDMDSEDLEILRRFLNLQARARREGT